MLTTHPGNQIASIVGLTADSEEEEAKVAMQVAAIDPIALDKKGISSSRSSTKRNRSW